MIELLALLCYGETDTVVTASARTYGAAGASTTNAYAPSSSAGTVEVEIDDTPRIRLPREIFPVMVRRGDGWRDLDEVTVSETEISGRFRLGLSRPSVRINRMNGEIRVSGFNLLTGGDYFEGVCERAPERTGPRF